MTDLAELTARLRRLEDDRDIRQLIASYGPAVDAGDADASARLWAIDGVYDVDGWRMEGRADVHAMIGSDAHQKLVRKGCSHFLGPCVVTVTGDEAVAVCESLVLVREDSKKGPTGCGAPPHTISRCAASTTSGRSSPAPAGCSTAIPTRTPCC